MALGPSNLPPQTPQFAAGAQQAPMQAQGKPQKPVTHGLVSGDEIDQRLAQMPREAQQGLLKAVAAIPDLPTIFGIAIGPEAHDYFQAIAEAIKQHQQSQQNSPAQGGPSAPTDAGQNPSAPAPQGDPSGGQPPAMATQTPPQAQFDPLLTYNFISPYKATLRFANPKSRT